SIVEPITVTTFEDNLFGVLKDANSSTCPSLPFVIAPDSNLTCSFVGYVAGVDGDIHENIITAIGHDDENNPTTVKAPKHIPIYALPIVDAVVTKTSNKASVPEPGGDVTYTFSVENSGSADLELTSLVDSVFGDVHCSTLPTTIKIGDTYTCSITKYISGNAGYINHNTVIAKPIEPIYKIPLDRNDSHQVEVTNVPPAITVTKVPNKTTVTSGESVTFTVTVYNHSHAEDFKLTDLDDSVFGNLLSATSTTCTLPQSIAADGDYSCSFSGLVSGSANSVHHNIVTAIGHDDENIVIEAKGPAHVGIGAPPSITVDPSIKVFKEAALNSVPEPGINDMEFTFTVENNSTVSDMNLTSLHDNIYGDVALDPACPSLPITIPQGAIYTCKITRAVMGSPRNSHVNTVKAIAVDSVYGYSVMHKTKEIINFTDVAPNMSVTYDTNTTCVENSGDSVQFSIRVQNESAVDEITLTDLVDADYGDLDGKGSCQLPQVIHVGGSYTCNFTEAATANSYVLSATAHDNENNIVISSSVTSVTVGSCNTGVPLPNVIVTKNTDKSTVVTPGEDVEFTFSVTNSSTTDAIITSLQDNLFGDVSCTALPYLLKVGQSYTCKHTEYISGSSGDTHQNRVTATLQVGLAVYHNDANKTIPVTDKPIAVPTFSEWGRLLLIVLFLLFAYRILRLQPKANTTRK
ncbi:MAG: hypothetical protein U9O83_02605, partial [Campylobacterota bacterium]|nr:hypothetical protein [Campylobacterota bacterium]